MKSFKLLFLMLVFGCTNSTYDKVSNENIDNERLEFAKQISHKLLNAQENGEYYQLKEKEATAKMVAGLDQKRQMSSYETISGKFGQYENLEFVELLKPKDGTLYEVYRFKGKFSSNAAVEIRTTLDGNGKLAGMYTLDWKNKM